MKNWIKEKLIKSLGIDKLQLENELLHNRFDALIRENGRLKYQNDEIVNYNNTLMSQFNFSSDIYARENESWAVISIHGKPEYVQFVNLHNRDMREIHSFLKKFERNNRVIDLPFGYNFLKY